MLKLGAARLLDTRDLTAVRALLRADPVASCMVAARVEAAGMEPWRLGGELWGFDSRGVRGGRLSGLCFAGPNLVPLRGDAAALRAFADRALLGRRACSSLVGPAQQVLELWSRLEPAWHPAREIRGEQPLLAMDTAPLITPDPLVRRVRAEELDRYLPAAVAMFIEEVGIDPAAEDGGRGYRARVAELIAAGRAFARFDGDEVVFKAEIGAMSEQVGQIQGVWVNPEYRGRGYGAAGTAAVVDILLRRYQRTASLYVNGYNTPAVAAYRRVGFSRVGDYATVLF